MDLVVIEMTEDQHKISVQIRQKDYWIEYDDTSSSIWNMEYIPMG